jgi:hypothetical protein
MVALTKAPGKGEGEGGKKCNLARINYLKINLHNEK